MKYVNVNRYNKPTKKTKNSVKKSIKKDKLNLFCYTMKYVHVNVKRYNKLTQNKKNVIKNLFEEDKTILLHSEECQYN